MLLRTTGFNNFKPVYRLKYPPSPPRAAFIFIIISLLLFFFSRRTMGMNSYEVDGPKAGSSKKAGSNFILPAITVCGIIMAIILLSVFFTRPKGGAAEDSLITALETELLSSISNETSRALSAETSLYVSLQAESSRTIASEANISDSVALEQSRAQIVEASIAVTATNSQFPSGGIIMWSGSTASIPSGWHLCDGTSGTPDLQDRFVVGAGLSYGVGNTGGAATVVLYRLMYP